MLLCKQCVSSCYSKPSTLSIKSCAFRKSSNIFWDERLSKLCCFNHARRNKMRTAYQKFICNNPLADSNIPYTIFCCIFLDGFPLPNERRKNIHDGFSRFRPTHPVVTYSAHYSLIMCVAFFVPYSYVYYPSKLSHTRSTGTARETSIFFLPPHYRNSARSGRRQRRRRRFCKAIFCVVCARARALPESAETHLERRRELCLSCVCVCVLCAQRRPQATSSGSSTWSAYAVRNDAGTRTPLSADGGGPELHIHMHSDSTDPRLKWIRY